MPDKRPPQRSARVVRETTPKEWVEDDSSPEVVGKASERQESEEEYHARIAELAYSYAGKRGFAPGGELDDWLSAEREIARQPATRELV
jgi:hypothetical protein